MIDLAEHAEGTVLPVLAQPGAKRTALLGERQGALRLAVTAPPDKGKANDALADLIADLLGCKRSSIRLLTGPTSRQKRFLILGQSADDLRDPLQTALRSLESPSG